MLFLITLYLCFLRSGPLDFKVLKIGPLVTLSYPSLIYIIRTKLDFGADPTQLLGLYYKIVTKDEYLFPLKVCRVTNNANF